MNSRFLRIAVVGTGSVATGNYLPILRDDKDLQVGLYNRVGERAKNAAEEFGGECLASLEEVAAWKPDSAFVLTSEQNHYDSAMTLIRLGVKRIFCEKPLVATNGQANVTEEDFFLAKALLEAAKTAGCQVAMNFNYRSFDQTLYAKRISMERGFGKLIQVVGQVHFACWSHCIDLVHHFGGGVEELTAISGSIVRSGQGGMVAPDVAASFRLLDGAVGTLIGTTGMAWQHPLFELTFTFENGRLHMRDIDGELEVLDANSQVHERRTLVRNASRWNDYGASFQKAIPAYLESVRIDSPPPVSGLDGLRELQVEAAIKRSISEKRAVRVQEELPFGDVARDNLAAPSPTKV